MTAKLDEGLRNLKQHYAELHKLGFRRDYRTRDFIIYVRQEPDNMVEVCFEPDGHHARHFYKNRMNESSTSFNTIPEMPKALAAQMEIIAKKRTGWKSPNDIAGERHAELGNAHGKEWGDREIAQASRHPDWAQSIAPDGQILTTRRNENDVIVHEWSITKT